MMDNQAGGKPTKGWRTAHRGPSDQAERATEEGPAPAEVHGDLAAAVGRVQRHELERRVERLTAELSRTKRTLAALARFRTIMDRAGEAIFIVEPETGRFVDVNETGLRWLGLPRSRLLSLSVADIEVEFPLEFRESDSAHVTDTRNMDRPWTFGGGAHRRRDGSSFPVEVAISQRRFGSRRYTLVVARESRPRRDAEQALRESEERYQTLFDLTPDAIYLTTRDGRIADVNQAAIDLFGYPREEFIGLRARNLYHTHDDIRRFQEGVEEHGFVRDRPIRFQASDGSCIDGLLTATLRHTGDGVIGGYQCLIRVPVEAVREVGAVEGPYAECATPAVEPQDDEAQEVVDATEVVASPGQDVRTSEEPTRTGEVAAAELTVFDSAETSAGEAETKGDPDVELVVNRLVGSAHGYELRDTDQGSEPPQIVAEPRPRPQIDQGRQTATRVEVKQRAPWETKPAKPTPPTDAAPASRWPLFALGVMCALYGWSEFSAASYPYASGIQEWQLSIRALAMALLGIAVAGSKRRFARVLSIGLLLLVVVLLGVFASYLADFPFGLKDVVPDTRSALFSAVRRATEFTVVAVLILSGMSWYLWRLSRDPRSNQNPLHSIADQH